MEQKNNTQTKNKKWIGISIVILICLVVGMFSVWYFSTQHNGESGTKTIAVEIIKPDNSREIKIKTDEEFLRGALEEKKLIEGKETEFGLFILTVDGLTADESKQEWWCITKSGEQVNTGVDTTPIADGDDFELTLKAGY